MNQQLQQFVEAIRRPAYFLAALAMAFGVSSGIVSAAAVGGQVQERSIKMSDNGVSGGTITSGIGSGTHVKYRVTFKAATSYTIKGVVVDFCKGTAGTPFIGDASCSAPTSFTVGGTPTVDTADYTDSVGTTAGLGSGWTASSLNSGQTFVMTNSTGTALTAGTSYTFEIQEITNPSDAAGTFYARLITYTSDTGDIASYAHNTPGTYQDYGGFALSTAFIVQVSAKVQETLSFCVLGTKTPANPGDPPSLTAPTDCGDAGATAPAITLGHGTNNTLDTSAVDTNGVFTIAATNALHGLAIRLHNSNSCGGLSTDNGTTCAIPATNSGANTPDVMVNGTAGFGMKCNDGTGGTGAITCDTNYNDGNATHWAMDTSTVGDNVTTTYGDVVAASTAPINAVTNKFEFAATASNTTPAGIYTANLAMIATGTF